MINGGHIMQSILALILLAAIAPVADIFANPSISADTIQLIDFKKVFTSSPLIYSFLSFLSISALAIWIYSVSTIRTKELVPQSFCKEIKELLEARNFDKAKDRCEKNLSLLAVSYTHLDVYKRQQFKWGLVFA